MIFSISSFALAMSALYSSSASSVVLTTAPPAERASLAFALFRLVRASSALFALFSASQS
jgi:hypothetical protein